MNAAAPDPAQPDARSDAAADGTTGVRPGSDAGADRHPGAQPLAIETVTVGIGPLLPDLSLIHI